MGSKLYYLIAEWEDAVLLGVGLALALPQATQVASTGSRGLQRNNMMESNTRSLDKWHIEETF